MLIHLILLHLKFLHLILLHLKFLHLVLLHLKFNHQEIQTLRENNGEEELGFWILFYFFKLKVGNKMVTFTYLALLLAETVLLPNWECEKFDANLPRFASCIFSVM